MGFVFLFVEMGSPLAITEMWQLLSQYDVVRARRKDSATSRGNS